MAGKAWFVTGSSRGLGRAIVQAALPAGDRVVATARRPGQVAGLAAEHGQSVLVLPLDVTEDDAAASAAEAAVARFGQIDVLVNNAGYATLASVEDMDMDEFRAQVDTDLFGVVTVTKAVLPVMRQQRSGHIINVSSLGARAATPGLATDRAAKWAVGGFTEVLALETAPLGIKVTAIEPGGIQTDWAGSSMSKPPVSQAYRLTVGMLAARMREPGRLPAGDPARIARVVVDLSETDSPPARVLLGSDAVTIAGAAAAALAGRDAAWREVSRSTDRDDATAAELDPPVAAPGPVTVVRRFLDEVVNGGNLDLIDELWAEDLAWHGGSLGDISGLPAFRTFVAAGAAGAFTGMHLTVEEIVPAGQKVVVRFTNSGTQTGPFLGTPPTGRHAEWLGIGLYTVTSGKISQAWFGDDVLGMLMQLGVVTLPGVTTTGSAAPTAADQHQIPQRAERKPDHA